MYDDKHDNMHNEIYDDMHGMYGSMHDDMNDIGHKYLWCLRGDDLLQLAFRPSSRHAVYQTLFPMPHPFLY